MLNFLPKPTKLPSFELMLDDIGNPTAHALARALGVTPRTVARWRKAGIAPRPVMLAIFWVTRWGMSKAHCDAHNVAVLHAGMAECLKREVKRLNAELAQLGRIADFGSANDPAPGVALPAVPLQLVHAPDVIPIRTRRQTKPPTAGATGEETQQPRGFQRG